MPDMRGVVVLGVLLLGDAAMAKDRLCTVEGQHVAPMFVDIVAKGAPPHRLRIENVAATVRLPAAAGPVPVEVRGALLFNATAPVDKLTIMPRAYVESTSGMVRLAPGAQGLHLHARGAKWAEGDVVIGDVTLRGVILPCDQLTLDAPEHSPPGSDPDAAAESFVPAQKTLKLRAAPNGGPQMDVVVNDPESLELHVIERGGGAVRVRTRWPDGSSLTGWAKTSDLKRPKRAGGSLEDLPHSRPPCTRTPEASGGALLAQATVSVDTPVSFDRLFEWAKVRTTDAVTVRYRPGERWVELVGVPGIASGGAECPDHGTALDEAWVPRTAVRLPDDRPLDAQTK
jgi:hypothetical protein